MKKDKKELEFIQQILNLPELTSLLQLQQTLGIRSKSLSEKSGITAVDFSRLRTSVLLGEGHEKYKFASLLHLKKMIQVVLQAVKKEKDATFPELEILIAFSEEDEKILLEEKKQNIAAQKKVAVEVFKREGDVLLFSAKVIQIFCDDTVVTQEQVSQLTLALLSSEDEERHNILRLAQEYKIRHRHATIGDFLQIL